MSETATAELEMPATLSMSHLRASEACLRRAHHEREGRVDTRDSMLGNLCHAACEQIGFTATLRGHESITVAEALRIAEAAWRAPERPGPLPQDVWAEARGLIGRWARRATFDANDLHEAGYSREFAGHVLTARIDVQNVHGDQAWITDIKTGWSDPPKELPLQGSIYAWHIFAEFPEVEGVHYREDRLRIDDDPEWFTVERDELGAIEDFLATAIVRLERAYEAQKLPPSPGSACMAFERPCPVARTCPVPEWAKLSVSIESDEEAVEQAEALFVEEARTAQRRKAIKGHLLATNQQTIVVGDQEVGFNGKPRREFQREKYIAAVEQAGVHLDPEGFYKVAKAATFGTRQAQS